MSTDRRLVIPFPPELSPLTSAEERAAAHEQNRVMGLLSVIEQRSGAMPIVTLIMQAIGAKLHRTPAFEALALEIEKLPPNPRAASEEQMEAVSQSILAASRAIRDTAEAARLERAKRGERLEDRPCDCPMCENERAQSAAAVRPTVTH